MARAVSLNWNVVLQCHELLREAALTSGGPYTTNGTAVTTSFTDTNVANCTTYYYVVSAVSNIGESTNSNEAAASVVGTSYFAVGAGDTSAVGAFVADTNYVGGTIAAVSTATINVSNVTNPAPQAVYQHERYGNMKYTFSGLTAGANYKVRLHWAEIYWTGAGQREFNVLVNGTQVLTNFDIFASSGGMNIAIIREYTVAPVAGSIGIVFTNGAEDQAKIDGIEIILQPPAAPANLTASGGNGQITLNWNAVPGVTGYNVKRSLSNGGPYTNVVSGITATNYTNTVFTSGTTYYYVVSSLAGVATKAPTPLRRMQRQLSPEFLPHGRPSILIVPLNPLAAANVDADGTGQNNLFKYVAGLDPTNPASGIRADDRRRDQSASTDEPDLQPHGAARGVTYKPQFTTDIVSGVWTQLTGYAGPVTNGSQATITDMNASPSNEFYRIDIGCNNCPYP